MADDAALDREMMMRAIELSRASGELGEFPFGALICRNREIVAESMSRVRAEGDVTRHAEATAISKAQKALRTTSLDDCTIFSNAEPCAACSYAIRESRIRRVVYALSSPHMGGVSKWHVLDDRDLSSSIPEVFAPPPEIVAGLMAAEAAEAIRAWSPLAARVLTNRGLLRVDGQPNAPHRRRLSDQLMTRLRRLYFDRFGRN